MQSKTSQRTRSSARPPGDSAAKNPEKTAIRPVADRTVRQRPRRLDALAESDGHIAPRSARRDPVGEPAGSSTTVVTNLVLDADQHQWLRLAAARKHGSTIAGLIREALHQAYGASGYPLVDVRRWRRRGD